MTDVVDRFLATYPPGVRALVQAARAFVRDVVPDATEALDDAARIVGYSIAPGYKGLVCTLILSKTGVKLGIVNAASLPDPAGLLEAAERSTSTS